jgi:hypothetical protein
MQAVYRSVAAALRRHAAGGRPLAVTVGFDGFVDEMTSVVGERRGLDDWSKMAAIPEFGAWVAGAAGRSALREIVIHRQDPGGCAVNLGDGLIALGVQLDCYATLGEPLHPAFAPFAAACRTCTSWAGVHGRTLALEFDDGKLMLCAVAQLAAFDPERLAGELADGAYRASCARSRLIALTNWTLYPHMTACWRLLQRQVYRTLDHRPVFFLDLVDPASRSAADIREMLSALPGFTETGDTVLGLNGTEANILARVLNLPSAADDPAGVRRQAQRLREAIGITEVVIHCVRFAAAARADDSTSVDGPWTTTPRKCTGAGDRFNAGYALGLLLGLPLAERCALGATSSGFFVREARSGSTAELAAFAEDFATSG